MDIAKILKDCPKGTKLYSPYCGECELVCVTDNNGISIKCEYFTHICFKDGSFLSNGECLLFPSKENRDWSKFQKRVEPKFKVGDKIKHKSQRCDICTVKDIQDNQYIFEEIWSTLSFDEQHLYELVSDKVEPKFKVGDRIKESIGGKREYVITLITPEVYVVKEENGYTYHVGFENENLYELVPNKFDISTLKPFDKVLVRDNNEQLWVIDLFGFHDDRMVYKFMCVGHNVNQCIPYEDNEYLLGTTDDCDEFYKTWE